MLNVVVTNGVCENGQQIINTHLRRLHVVLIVKRRMHKARVDLPPSVAQAMPFKAIYVKSALIAPLEHRYGIILAFQQHIYSFATQL